ncbi:MAG: methylmalonyl Co-A mutase-associated GTPase MeaB [Nitrospirota bacterium]|nr:methylmalonyl Co-A mutase-associated GTPase MeaB [Nitrospirota bacterium]
MDDVDVLAAQVKAGNIRAVSRAITLLEDLGPDGLAILQALEPVLHRSAVIGVTGYPGAGKSTLIDQLITAYRQQGKTVGVLAIDISSPRTGGALLGDRIRMHAHALDTGVYIRSMATRGQRGGLAHATREAVTLLDAADFDVVLVETIGVGQGDIDVLDVADTVVAVVAPGLGDGIQAMKAGLLEVAHIIVVNKADHAGAEATLKDLREWYPHVLSTVAVNGTGIPDVMAAITAHQHVAPAPREVQSNSDVRVVH